MFDYLLYFLITLVFSTLFGVVGIGSSLVLVPLFTILGIDFNFAKAIGLFANGVTTISMTLNNIQKKVFELKDVFVLVIVSSIFAILGAYSSNYISQEIVKTLFVLFIFLSLSLLYMGHVKVSSNSSNKEFVKICIIVGIISFVGGLIGVGGGAVYLPLLIYLGMKIKESIAITSALIPVVSFSAFFTYTTFVEIDWLILIAVALGAIMGGYFGSTIMHKIKNDKSLKIIMSILLVFIAIMMIFTQLRGVE